MYSGTRAYGSLIFDKVLYANLILLGRDVLRCLPGCPSLCASTRICRCDILSLAGLALVSSIEQCLQSAVQGILCSCAPSESDSSVFHTAILIFASTSNHIVDPLRRSLLTPCLPWFGVRPFDGCPFFSLSFRLFVLGRIDFRASRGTFFFTTCRYPQHHSHDRQHQKSWTAQRVSRRRHGYYLESPW